VQWPQQAAIGVFSEKSAAGIPEAHHGVAHHADERAHPEQIARQGGRSLGFPLPATGACAPARAEIRRGDIEKGIGHRDPGSLQGLAALGLAGLIELRVAAFPFPEFLDGQPRAFLRGHQYHGILQVHAQLQGKPCAEEFGIQVQLVIQGADLFGREGAGLPGDAYGTGGQVQAEGTTGSQKTTGGRARADGDIEGEQAAELAQGQEDLPSAGNGQKVFAQGLAVEHGAHQDALRLGQGWQRLGTEAQGDSQRSGQQPVASSPHRPGPSLGWHCRRWG